MARLAALLMVPVAASLASCALFHTTSAPPAGMGQEALDGKFAFIVSNVNTSPTFGRTPAQGVYVIVSMAVRNVGTEAQFFEMVKEVFDVPPDVRPTQIVLHDSASSHGVPVNLTHP
jgi:hypothetical protein